MGADIAQEALDLAKQRVPQARLVVRNIEKEFLTEQFDLVMSLQVMEHILNDMVALQNIAQMAKKFVLISTLQGKMRPSEISLGHLRNYSAQELRLKVEAVGLEVLQLWGLGISLLFSSLIPAQIAEWLPGGPPLLANE